MSVTLSQQEALSQITILMESHNLSVGDVKKSVASRKRSLKDESKILSKGELILRLFAYLGGTLIFAGLGVFIETIWQDIGSLSRVIITFGSGFTAYICGLIFASDIRFSKIATPAFIIAFILQPFGFFVLLKEYFPGGDAALGSMVVFAPLALQQGLTFLKFRFPSLLLFTLLYLIGFVGGIVEYFDLNRGMASLVFGVFLLAVSIDLQFKDKFKDLTPLFFIIATITFFAGVYYFIGRTVFDPLALSLILFLLGFAVLRKSKTLYVLSLLYMAGYFIGGPGGGWASEWTNYNEVAAIFTGSSLVLTGEWLRSRTNYISLYPVWMFVGTCYALAGVYALFQDSWLEPLSVAIAALAIYGALLMRSRAVLAASVLSLIGFIVTYTAEHFANTVGWPLLLIFLGIVILGAGFIFARLAGRIKSASTP